MKHVLDRASAAPVTPHGSHGVIGPTQAVSEDIGGQVGRSAGDLGRVVQSATCTHRFSRAQACSRHLQARKTTLSSSAGSDGARVSGVCKAAYNALSNRDRSTGASDDKRLQELARAPTRAGSRGSALQPKQLASSSLEWQRRPRRPCRAYGTARRDAGQQRREELGLEAAGAPRTPRESAKVHLHYTERPPVLAVLMIDKLETSTPPPLRRASAPTGTFRALGRGPGFPPRRRPSAPGALLVLLTTLATPSPRPTDSGPPSLLTQSRVNNSACS